MPRFNKGDRVIVIKDAINTGAASLVGKKGEVFREKARRFGDVGVIFDNGSTVISMYDDELALDEGSATVKEGAHVEVISTGDTGVVTGSQYNQGTFTQMWQVTLDPGATGSYSYIEGAPIWVSTDGLKVVA